MIRRIIAVAAVAAVAAAVAMAPVAASAVGTYPAPEDSASASATTVAPCGSFVVTVAGPNGSQAQLQFTFPGTNAFTVDGVEGKETTPVKVIVDNEATFAVTAPCESGVLGITGLIDGVAVDTLSITIAAEAGTDTGGATGTDGGVAAGGDELSATGFESRGLAIGAGALLVAGAGAVFVAARRRSAQNAR